VDAGNTGVKSVVPTLIQEHGEGARSIESKLDDLAALPEQCLSARKRSKRSVRSVTTPAAWPSKAPASATKGQEPRADEWPMRPDLLDLATRWSLGTAW
jgi:hypothetical protein